MAPLSVARPRRLLSLVVAVVVGLVALGVPALTAAPASADPIIGISPPFVPPASVGAAYAQAFTASGGVGPYAFNVTAGALPPGLALANGVVSGTPTAGGSFSFTLTATDADGFTGAQGYTLTVDPPTVFVSPPLLFNGAIGLASSQVVTASGGTAPYTFVVTAGSLPAGLTLSSGGVLSGTPTAAGTFNFTVTATDASTGTGPFSGSRSYAFTVTAPTVSVSPTTVPSGSVGAAYSQTLTSTGGTEPYAFAVTAGSLPAGLALSSGGVLSGTPTAAGTFNFTVTATDASTGAGPFTGSRAYALTVTAPTISISPTSVPSGSVGTAYSQTLTASGGTAPTTFSITAGVLPPGIALSSAGVLSGTPTTNGSFGFTVTATDSSTGTGPFGGSRAYVLTIGPVAWAVAFDSAGGTAVPGQAVVAGQPAAEPSPAPTRHGYAFGGWFTAPAPGGSAWDFATPVTGPITLHAHWTPVVVPPPVDPPAPLCHGLPATIVGTPGADLLVGTEGRDVVVAFAGDDVVIGLGGDDVVCAGGGDDLVRGRRGDDWLSGGAGDDHVYGGKGRDVLRGGTGDDRLWGRSGEDELHGGPGHDVIRADSGHVVADRR